ncbi:general stress protein [Mesorhizobium sp.]|uniref:general stress protein n=1 Tax=Mesorhizobium sp. TaxID=1871066 RepID=UPI00345C0B2F
MIVVCGAAFSVPQRGLGRNKGQNVVSLSKPATRLPCYDDSCWVPTVSGARRLRGNGGHPKADDGGGSIDDRPITRNACFGCSAGPNARAPRTSVVGTARTMACKQRAGGSLLIPISDRRVDDRRRAIHKIFRAERPPRAPVLPIQGSQTSLEFTPRPSGTRWSSDMPNRGGRHEQHVKAGQQSHKNRDQDRRRGSGQQQAENRNMGQHRGGSGSFAEDRERASEAGRTGGQS